METITPLQVLQFLEDFYNTLGWKIAFVVAFTIICGSLIQLACFIVKKLLYFTKINGSAATFITPILRIVLWVILLLFDANFLDISTSSLLVCMSAVSLALSLALQDSLSNLANGVLILINKPFTRGDMVNIDGVDGRIFNIRLMTVEMISLDNKRIIIPNSKVLNTVINYSSLSTRRIEYDFTVAQESDVEGLVKRVYADCFAEELILNHPKPYLYVTGHTTSTLDLRLEVWTSTENYYATVKKVPSVVEGSIAAVGLKLPYDYLAVEYVKDIKAEEAARAGETQSPPAAEDGKGGAL